MPALTPTRVASILIPAAGLGLALIGQASVTGDYAAHGTVAGDNAGPAILALSHLHLAAAAQHQPLMGLTSLLLRAPVQRLAELVGASGTGAYRLGVIVCLLPTCLLAGWLIARARGSHRQLLAAAVAALAMLAGPATRAAIALGHPEEILAATLATAAVIAARRERLTAASLLCGAAVATKPWAVLALPCVLLALPDRRWAGLWRSAAVGLPLLGALPVLNSAAFSRAAHAVGDTRSTNPLSLWWPLGGRFPVSTPTTVHLLPLGLDRSIAGTLAVVALAGAAAALLAARLGRRGSAVQPLALLALLGVSRCLADPAPLQYYAVAAIVPIAAWEALEADRLPIVTALSWAGIAVLFSGGWLDRVGPAGGDAAMLAAAAVLWFVLVRGAAQLPSLATRLRRPRPSAVVIAR